MHATRPRTIVLPLALFALLTVLGTAFFARNSSHPTTRSAEVVPSLAEAFAAAAVVGPPPSHARLVRGIVLRRDGTVATAATAYLGDAHSNTDIHGEYRLSISSGTRGMRQLVAVEAGSQAAVSSDRSWETQLSSSEIRIQTLVLGPPPLSIRGHVRDDQGRPLSGCRILLIDSVAAGATLAWSAEAATGRLEGAPEWVTSHTGSFELRGLSDRPYRLQVAEPTRYGLLVTDPIQAGRDDVVITFAADSVVPNVHGRVVEADGTPGAGLRISWGIPEDATVDPRVRLCGFGTELETGEDGSFQFESMPRRLANIVVLGDARVASTQVPVEELDLEQPLTIVAHRDVSFRVMAAGRGPDLALTAHDERGRTLGIRTWKRGYPFSPCLVLEEQTYHVSASVTELRLLSRDGTVLARQSVTLDPDRESTVQF